MTATNSPATSPAPVCDTGTTNGGAYRWELLVILWIAFFLHQGCRQIYNSVIPLIRDDLGLTNVQAGLVSSIFTLVYGLLVPVAGLVGDRFARKWLVVLSLLVFTGGTLLTGFSTSLVMLVIFISVTTGGGEAFFYPAATSLLAQWHERTRALALGILQTGLYFGLTLSGWLAGWIGQQHGWRNSFLVFGGVGLFWTVVVAWRLRNTPFPTVQNANSNRVPLGEVLSTVGRCPTVWLLSLAFGAMVFVNVGYLTWTPAFLHERFNLTLAQAGLNALVYHFAGAFIGVLVGSRVADRLARTYPAARLYMNFFGLLLGAPFLYLLGRSETAQGCYIVLGLFGLFRGFYDSNLFASLYEVVDPRIRASATGLMLAFAFVTGCSAPTLLGWMKTVVGLGIGLSALSAFYVFGALCILAALQFCFRRDHMKMQSGVSLNENH